LAALLLALTVMYHRLRRMDKVLQTSEERFRLAVAGTRDGIWDWDLASNRAYVSPRFQEIMNPPNGAEMIVDPLAAWTERMDPTDRERFMTLLQAYLDTGGDRQFTTEYRLGGDTEDPVWVVMRGKALRDATGKVVRMSGSISDVSDRKQQETEMKRLEHRALHDVLTGLPNRAYFIDQVQQALKAAELEQTRVALIFMDLDGFKEINDTLGHQTGDLVLQQAAQRLRQALRVSDTIARFGGDEFSVLLPGSNGVNASAVAQKILHAFAMPFVLGTRNLNLGISLGISLYPDHGKEIATLVECADTAMYSAKRTKNGFVVYPTV
jgi:diguanylate cyclase (GGDEF)-like protein/PAS domain S-box-containing protein